MDKKELKSKLVLLSNKAKNKTETNNIELNEAELAIKEKLIAIEKKIDSLEKVIEVISNELPETFYSSEIFLTIIAGSALNAATDVVNEVFGVEKKSDNPLL